MPKTKIDITESPEVLAHLLKQENDENRYKRLRMLYLLKTKKVTTINHIAQILGRHPSTLHSWLNAYRHGGLEECLQVRRERFCDIPEWVVSHLVEHLQDVQFFPPLREVQAWVINELDFPITYACLHRLLKSEVAPKLKWHPSNPINQTDQKIPIEGMLRIEELGLGVYEYFYQWKAERGFPNNTQALNQLLGEFFKLRATHGTSSFQQMGKTLVDSLAQGELVPSIPYHIPDLLIQNRLAERLKVDDSTLSRERGKRTFPGWTKQRDPDGVGWLWIPDLRKYRPLLSSEEIKSILLSPNLLNKRYAST